MKFLRYFRPVLIASITVSIYILLYHPPIDTTSPDFLTASMSFFAILGWSSMIIFTMENKVTPLIIYGTVAVLSPLIMFFTLKSFQPQHAVAFLLFMIAFVGLRFYVGAHLDYEKKKRKKK